MSIVGVKAHTVCIKLSVFFRLYYPSPELNYYPSSSNFAGPLEKCFWDVLNTQASEIGELV